MVTRLDHDHMRKVLWVQDMTRKKPQLKELMRIATMAAKLDEE